MLAKIEPRIVMLIKMSSKCNQELTKAEVLEFVNGYIQGTRLEKEYIEWRLTHHKKWRSDYDPKNTIQSGEAVGDGWFKNFCKRWEDEIGYTQGKNTARFRKDFCQYLHFVSMYNNIYKLFLEHGYAERMPEPCYFDNKGKAIDRYSNGLSFGKLVDLKFTRPDLIFVADEYGTNTNMSKEKLSIWNNKYLHTKGCGVLIPSCTSDTHFTTMGNNILEW